VRRQVKIDDHHHLQPDLLAGVINPNKRIAPEDRRAGTGTSLGSALAEAPGVGVAAAAVRPIEAAVALRTTGVGAPVDPANAGATDETGPIQLTER
jgi:hypothetical protein